MRYFLKVFLILIFSLSLSANEKKEHLPSWIYTANQYKYFGLATANNHIKGKHYQENVARSKAKRKIILLFEQDRLSYKTKKEYISHFEEKKYMDQDKKVYVLIYLDNGYI